MRVRIVVADQTEARFYDGMGFGRPLIQVGLLTNPTGRMRDQDLVSDRPGRVFERAADPHHRRGASARHSSGPEHVARRHAVEVFARRIGAELDRAGRARRFDAVVIVANATLLGRIRAALPPQVRARVTATVVKDLRQHTITEVMDHLPRDVFAGKVRFEAARRTAPGAIQ